MLGNPSAVTAANVRFYAQAVIFGTATIAFYRGAWMLQDMFLFPGNPLASALVSVFIGLTFFTLFDNALI